MKSVKEPPIMTDYYCVFTKIAKRYDMKYCCAGISIDETFSSSRCNIFQCVLERQVLCNSTKFLAVPMVHVLLDKPIPPKCFCKFPIFKHLKFSTDLILSNWPTTACWTAC